MNKVQSKHVDFVLCDQRTIAPLLVVELDDSSHRRIDRKSRDLFVDRALEAAGLPILRCPVKSVYAVDEIREAINRHLNVTVGVV